MEFFLDALTDFLNLLFSMPFFIHLSLISIIFIIFIIYIYSKKSNSKKTTEDNKKVN